MAEVLLFSLWLAGLAALAWCYRETLQSLWREPVLTRPVLILESDDWGPGPTLQAPRLQGVIKLLSRFRDRDGRHPVMTLGVVLALPDTNQIRENNLWRYEHLLLSDPQFGQIVDVMKHGEASGVFSLQLHGMEHFWPSALMAAASTDAGVRAWLESDENPATEDLPPHIQSRWTDAAALPSKTLPGNQIRSAATEEVQCFSVIFGRPPRVVVPPTFLWNELAEEAWATAGVCIVVTPGRRFTARDHEGRLIADRMHIYNGQIASTGVTYVVRDDYFEPALGHTAQQGLAALERKSRLARPALLEMHRFNFIRETETADTAFQELEKLLESAMERFPGLLFLSTEELGEAFRNRNTDLIETGLKQRLYIWLLRVKEIPRLYKLSWLSGVIIPAWLLFLACKPGRGCTNE